MRPARLALLSTLAVQLGFLVGLRADELPRDAAELVRQARSEVDAVQKKADAEIQTRVDKLIQELQTLQESYTKAGKLDEAVAIRDTIRRLKANPKTGFAPPAPGAGIPPRPGFPGPPPGPPSKEFPSAERPDPLLPKVVKVERLPELKLPTSTAPGNSLLKERRREGGTAITTLSLPVEKAVGDVVVTVKGDAFFILTNEGVLSRVAFTDFIEERRLDMHRRCTWLSLSAEGLLAAMADLHEVWVIDPATLEVKKRIAAPNVDRVLSGPSLRFALTIGVARHPGGISPEGVVYLDLVKGEPVHQFHPHVQHARMTPDGKHYYAHGGNSQLVGYRIEDARLVQEQTTQSFVSGGQTICVSPDSKYVCLPGTGSGTFVYRVGNLSRPDFTITIAGYLRHVAFDPAGQLMYVHSGETMQVYSLTGIKLRDTKLTSGRMVPHEDLRQLVAHPLGKRLLAVTSRSLLFVDLEPDVGSAPAPPTKPGELSSGPAWRPPPASLSEAGFKPAPLTGPTASVALPAPAHSAHVGGGGRYLFFNIADQRRLAVFDTNEARIVRYIPVPDQKVLVAASLSKLFIAVPGSGTIHRYSLATFERELTTNLPVPGSLQGMFIGSASHGPLVLGVSGSPGRGLLFLDPLTMKDTGIQVTPEQSHLGFGGEYPNEMRMSAEGNVLAVWRPRVSPGGLGALVRQGSTYHYYYDHISPGPIYPSPDGRVLYTAGQRYTPDTKPIGKAVGGRGNLTLYLPALHGQFWLSLTDRGLNTFGGTKFRLDLHLGDETRPLVSFPDIPVLDDLVSPGGTVQPLDRHVFLIPEAKLLAVLRPKTKTELLLFRFDFDELLKVSEVDYLFVQSQAPVRFVRGTAFAYAMQVRSKKGSVSCKLEAGPEGMTVTADGRVTWNPPKAFAAAEVDVVILVTDGSRQEIFHSFKLARADETPGDAAKGGP